MKKFLSICLILGLLAFGGCGKQPADSAAGGSGNSSLVSGDVSDTQPDGTQTADARSIPGVKEGVYFGMTKAELDQLEPELEFDDSETNENWCSFETVGGTPLYDLAVSKDSYVVNSYTFINGKLANLQLISSSNQFGEDEFNRLAEAYGELYDAQVTTNKQTVEFGMVSYTASLGTERGKVSIELLTDIPADQAQENYLTVLFEPVAL